MPRKPKPTSESTPSESQHDPTEPAVRNNPDEPAPESSADTSSVDEQLPDPNDPPSAPIVRRRPRLLRPTEALDRLDRQWEDRTPLRERAQVSLFQPTVAEDPYGFDYFGAMGVSLPEIRDAFQSWLEAQLAADALQLGRTLRPVVSLVPVAGLWFVVRVAVGIIVVFDGPGYPSPAAAVSAARIRYRAMMAAELADEESDDADEPEGEPAELYAGTSEAEA